MEQKHEMVLCWDGGGAEAKLAQTQNRIQRNETAAAVTATTIESVEWLQMEQKHEMVLCCDGGGTEAKLTQTQKRIQHNETAAAVPSAAIKICEICGICVTINFKLSINYATLTSSTLLRLDIKNK